jgi:hypothetical protein
VKGRTTFSGRAKPTGVVIAGLLAAAIGGCSSWRPDCPACTDPNFLTNSCPYSETMLTPTANPQLLFLSGGAAYGAWGAGVLVGWSQRPGGRPAFRVVTGISTGALQAPLVFLGMDAKLEEFYTQTRNQDVYRLALLRNAIQSRQPLKDRIDDTLKNPQIRQIAAILDRELFVGTVNLDSGDFCSWNLSQVARKATAAESASQTQKAKCFFDLFRDVIFAASGSPVLAPPVEIDADHCETFGEADAPPWRGAMHVDGGVRLRVFASGVLEAAAGSTTSTAYVIVNGKMALHEQCTVDSIAPIAVRSMQILMSESMFGNLHYLENQLSNAWMLKLSSIPNERALDFSSGDFQPAKMKVLFDAGKAEWQGDPWETDMPDERVVKAPAETPRLLLGCRP